MGCTNSTPAAEPAAPPAPGPSSEEQKEAQRKFKERQAKMEQEKADKAKEEALRKEADEKVAAVDKEATEATAEAIANQMTADMAEKQIEEAQKADEAAQEEQSKNVMESFKGMGAKLRFREAMDKGMKDEAKDAAACMLQGAWRARVARKAVVAKRAEKKFLLQNGMARRIQSRIRCRQAWKKSAAKREEKKALVAAEAERRAEVEKAAAAPVAVEQIKVAVGPPAMKMGMIKKEGSMVKNWKTRHFVLRNVSPTLARLTYFETAKTTEPFGNDEKGVVDITKASKITNVTQKTLTLVGADGKNLNLEFLLPTDISPWRQALEDHIKYVSK